MKHAAWWLLLFTCTAVAAEPVIETFAGGGTSGLGDGGPAAQARLSSPTSLALDGQGNLYIAEGADTYDACRVRRVDRNGTITTFAGNGTRGLAGENVPATSVSVCPTALAFDGAGNLYVGEHSRVRRISPAGIISTFAGNGNWGYSGDGGQARSASIGIVLDIAVDSIGRPYIVDNASQRIRRVAANGIISTIAGNGGSLASGDGGPALAAAMSPRSVAVDMAGNVFFADGSNDTLRRVDTTGIVTRLAGDGPFRTDPLAINAELYLPRGIALGARGEIYIANEANLVHVVSAGILGVVAGDYNDSTFAPYGAWWGYGGDGGPALAAVLNRPQDVAVDGVGNLYVADTENHRIRRISPPVLPGTPLGVDAFAAFTRTAVGGFTNGLTAGDFNGDGRLDIAVATSGWSPPYDDPATDYRINVFLQQPNGTLAQPVRLPFGVHRYVGRVRSGDLNRDAYADLVLATNSGLHIYLGGPAGLSPGPILQGLPNAEVPGDFLIGHVDQDDRADIVAWMGGQRAGGTSPSDLLGLTIFYGDGSGNAPRKRFLQQPTASAGALAWLDVNRDGRSDLVSTWQRDRSDSGVRVFLHDNGESFGNPADVAIGMGEFGTSIATGDFDGDGLQDVVLPRQRNAPDAALALLLQKPGGRLEFSSSWRTFDLPIEVIGSDIGNDGRDDLLILHSGWDSVGYQVQLQGRSGTRFDTSVKYQIQESSNQAPGSLVSGDLNGDGCRDVAVSDRNNGLLILYSKRCMQWRAGSQPLLPPNTTVAGATQQSNSLGAEPQATAGTDSPVLPAGLVARWTGVALGGVDAASRRIKRIGNWMPVSLAVLVFLLFGGWWWFRIRGLR